MTGELTVVGYDPAHRETWDALVRGARAAHFMFERAYMEYHADRFADASLLVLRDGRPLAAFPATRDGDEVVSHAGLTFGGLLSGPSLTTVLAVEAVAAIATALHGDGVRRVVVKPVPHLYHRTPAEEELVALHAAGAQLVRRDVTVAVRGAGGYSTERRRSVKRGHAAGLELGESPRLADFMRLVTDVLGARHDTRPVHSGDELALLAGRFPDGIRLFTATRDDELLAGVLVFQTPLVAHAQYIANSDAGRKLRALDALTDHLIADVYRDRWFDLGTSNERDGEINSGLLRHKEGFGARAVVQDRYALDL